MKFNCFKVYVNDSDNKKYLFPSLRICRVLSGDFIWQVGEAKYELSKGDIILLNNIVSRSIIKKNNLQIELEVFEFLPYEVKSGASLLRAFYSEDPLILREDDAAVINNVLSVISLSLTETQNEEFFTHLFLSVFSLIRDKSKNSTSNEVAFAAAEYIWGHFSEALTVSDIARLLSVSKSHLESVFKKVHGVCVGEYLRRIRVYQVTKRIEENPELSVLDIALSSGFGSSSGFYKAYKSITGQPPRRIKTI